MALRLHAQAFRPRVAMKYEKDRPLPPEPEPLQHSNSMHNPELWYGAHD